MKPFTWQDTLWLGAALWFVGLALLYGGRDELAWIPISMGSYALGFYHGTGKEKMERY